MEKKRGLPFMPTSKKEMEHLGWENVDVIIFSGDAYIDHPAFGTAVISRVLESAGYRVAVVPQPNWRDDLRDFKKLGKPRLFFGVNSGAMDSMVNHYTAAKRLRSNDAYTPDGAPARRPDYAVKVYTEILKKLYPDVPVVIGGIEASLRRFAHYDYWQDRLMPSVLDWCKADYLIYGMGERAILDLAEYIKRGRKEGYEKIGKPRQVAWISHDRPSGNEIILHPFHEIAADKKKFIENFNLIEQQANMASSPVMVEEQSPGNFLYVNPPYPLPTTEEVDSWYDLPYSKLPHPRYKGKHIPAYEMIKFSMNTHRGCFGGCSFCTIAAHQGKTIQSRSEKSIIREAEKLRHLPGFAGNISDLGGPTANMYGMGGKDKSLCTKCKRKSCLYPNLCTNLDTSHKRLLKLYDAISEISGIKHVYIGSGIRYDLFLNEKGFLDDIAYDYFCKLVKEHTGGRLKVAPEHTEKHVLHLMNKPGFELYEKLQSEFFKVAERSGLNYTIVPYFISSHPGCRLQDMQKLASHKSLKKVHVEQVQDFTPTPMTKSSVIFYTGMDLKTLNPVYVERDMKKKKEQKAYFFNLGK